LLAFFFKSFQVFVSVRSDVAPHLYDDVIPCLEWLTKDQGVKVAVLTNGNANLTTCPVLGQYVSMTIGAGEVGAMKPSPVPFVAMCQKAGVVPSRMLFVGDSYENDVLGAAKVGIYSALLTRSTRAEIQNSTCSAPSAASATATVTADLSDRKNVEDDSVARFICDSSLSNLHPDEFGSKITQFLRNRRQS
jgi:FMN phosphatase YigB (HAD superfamily)